MAGETLATWTKFGKPRCNRGPTAWYTNPKAGASHRILVARLSEGIEKTRIEKIRKKCLCQKIFSGFVCSILRPAFATKHTFFK